MGFIDELKKKIDEKRKIRESSLNAYVFNINKLYKLMFDNKEIPNLDFLNKKDDVMKTIDSKKLSTRKTYLASIVVALMAFDKDEKLIEFYRKEMEDLAKKFNEEMNEQKKSERQSENWVSLDKLNKILKQIRNELNSKGIFEKDTLTNKQFDLLQQWVVGSLYLLQPPLRNDYIMKVISKKEYDDLTEEEKKKQNYLVNISPKKKMFSIGEYKTAGLYGTKTFPVSRKLNSVLNIWLKFNKTGNLLVNSKKEPITPNSLTKLLNKTFEDTGKKISSTMIRHIYISEKFPPQLEEKQQIANQMGHSVKQQELYSKK